MRIVVALLAVIALSAPPTIAASDYARHVIFDNDRAGTGGFYYGAGRMIAPSSLMLDHDHVPLADVAHSPPNSLRLAWRSQSGGNWRVELAARREVNAGPLIGRELSFWLYSEAPLAATDAPRLTLVGDDGTATPWRPLIGGAARLPARQWTRVAIPLADFTGLYRGTRHEAVSAGHLARLIITQGLDDGVAHTVYLDDVRIDDPVPDARPPAAPGIPFAQGFERHVELEWPAVTGADAYRIERDSGTGFRPVAVQNGRYTRYEDFVGAPGTTASYRVAALDAQGRASPPSPVVAARTRAMSDDELLTMIQHGNFRYYWEGAHPNAGMAIEITPGDPDQVALGASGFGIVALIAGADRGFVARDAVRARLDTITRFLDHADRFHGAWPHFLDGRTGKTMAVFGQYDDGGDLVETAFLIQGLLTARAYFDRDTPAERALRATITRLWQGVEWDWYRQRPDSDFLYWHWSPDHGFHIGHPLVGWNETLIVYLLAIASPTHPVPASLWHTGWAGTSPLAVAYRQNWSRTRDGDHFVNGHSYYGIPLAVGEGNGAELFFTQFSFLGFDPRGKRDAYADYFDNNRAIALIQQRYAIDNPRGFAGYGADAWGQSAGVHSGGGRARPADDNGTLVIHAALASMPYTPAESMAALRHYYRDLGSKLWGVYGFSDSFNATQNWYDEVYMGLNQAQTVAMIENYRSGLLWRLFMANPEINPALARIGFRPDGAGREKK